MAGDDLRADPRIYDPAAYGQAWAGDYDVLYPGGPDAEAIADRVAELAAGGRVLELAIGTGRVALPLAARGVEVHGIDASPAMVARLRAKPGGGDVPVVVGDMTEARADGRFAVVLLVFNTLFALPDQASQIRCFANAARHLDDGGVFVVEAFVPDVARFDRGQRVDARLVEDGRVGLDVARHDPLAQTVNSALVLLTADGTRVLPVALRYAWPAELDLMARLAGLRLRERWGGWAGEPLTAGSPRHVSVYARA